MRRSESIRNSTQRYNPGFGADREWKNDAVVSIVYMIQERNLDSNVDTDDILSLLAEWDADVRIYQTSLKSILKLTFCCWKPCSIEIS